MVRILKGPRLEISEGPQGENFEGSPGQKFQGSLVVKIARVPGSRIRKGPRPLPAAPPAPS